jgi:trimethylamine:corrinoid methyltransferase-like protein
LPEHLTAGPCLPSTVEYLTGVGAVFNADTGRMTFPRAVVEDILARTNREFLMAGRDPKQTGMCPAPVIRSELTLAQALSKLVTIIRAARRGIAQSALDFIGILLVLKPFRHLPRAFAGAAQGQNEQRY